jgi:hypothetical protein
MLSYL